MVSAGTATQHILIGFAQIPRAALEASGHSNTHPPHRHHLTPCGFTIDYDKVSMSSAVHAVSCYVVGREIDALMPLNVPQCTNAHAGTMC